MKTVLSPLTTFGALYNIGIVMDVALIERLILEAWDDGLTGDDVVSYVSAMSSQPYFVVKPVLDAMIGKMSE